MNAGAACATAQNASANERANNERALAEVSRRSDAALLLRHLQRRNAAPTNKPRRVAMHDPASGQRWQASQRAITTNRVRESRVRNRCAALGRARRYGQSRRAAAATNTPTIERGTEVIELQTSDHIQRIEEARHRLEVLYADTAHQYHTIHLGPPTRQAIRTLLDELHRLHLAVSEQRRTLKNIATRENKRARKPSAARSQQPTAHSIRARKDSHRP